MFYSLLSSIINSAEPFHSDIASQYVFGITFAINIVISLLMLPINIRLAGQLVMQVFKYRYICNYVATMDEDNKVMTGYYNHFRSVMCIILSMVGFNVFNVISGVLFLVKFFKWDWGGVWWNWWLAQGFRNAFEECIIFYAVTMLHQIACYFKGEQFRFLAITMIIVLRFLYTSVLVGIAESIISVGISDFGLSVKVVTVIVFIILSIIMFESMLRFPVLFSYIRSAQRIVSQYISEFINESDAGFLDKQHFVDKILAGRFFQIAGWGTIFVSFLTSLAYAFEYIICLIYTLISYIQISSLCKCILNISALLIISLIQVASILPSILYCAFLIILWIYFRDKTKIKYSGYSSNDPEVVRRVHEPSNNLFSNQDKFHFTYYKHKKRVMITTYVICVVLASVLFAVLIAPVLREKWRWSITLKPGDYYLLGEEDVLKYSHCDENVTFVMENVVENSCSIPKSLNCKDHIFAAKINSNLTQHTAYQYDISSSDNLEIWLPSNSVVLKVPSFNLSLQTPFPCYYPTSVSIPFRVNMINRIAKDSCREAKLIEEYPLNCTSSSVDGKLSCTVGESAMYTLHANSNFTVQQFGNVTDQSSLIHFENVTTDQYENYDMIIFHSTENIIDPNQVCNIQASCMRHPALVILVSVLILLTSTIALSADLMLIHRYS